MLQITTSIFYVYNIYLNKSFILFFLYVSQVIDVKVFVKISFLRYRLNNKVLFDIVVSDVCLSFLHFFTTQRTDFYHISCVGVFWLYI